MDNSFVKNHFVGRDGFIWWIGQVADEEVWKGNIPGHPLSDNSDNPGFAERYKVRIMGYHTAAISELEDSELPWATVMYPVTAGGGGGGSSQNANLTQGCFVFGFFMDGDQAQVPVIMGTLGYNDYQAVKKNIPDANFVPFSGYTPKEKISAYMVKAEESEGVKIEQEQSEGADINEQQVVGNGGSTKDLASKEMAKDGAKVTALDQPVSCRPIPTAKITTLVKNLVQEIESLKRAQIERPYALVKEVSEFQEEIDKKVKESAEMIAGPFKQMLGVVQKNVTEKVNDKVKDTYIDFFPNARQDLKKEVETINDAIACQFRNLAGGLLDMIGNFLNDAINKLVNAASCFIDNMVGAMMGSLASAIENSLSGMFDSINGMLGGAGGGISFPAGEALGIIQDVLSFLDCEQDPTCPKTSEVSLWNGGTSSPSSSNIAGLAGGFSNMFPKIKAPELDLPNLDFGGVFGANSCDTGPNKCGPPLLEFSSPTGVGAAGNLIVSRLGEILGADMKTVGANYAGGTTARVIDPCGIGRGAVVEPVLDGEGGVIDIRVIQPGIDYIGQPDGSTGGDGRVWAKPDDTSITHANGDVEIPRAPGTVLSVVAGDTVLMPPGTTITTEPLSPVDIQEAAARTPLIGEEIAGLSDVAPTTRITTPDGQVTPEFGVGGDEIIPGGKPYVMKAPGKFTAPARPVKQDDGVYPTESTGAYPAILTLCEVFIDSPGYGYSENDTVTIEPNFGATVVPQFNDIGSLMSVKVTQTGQGFTEMPEVYIKSETGFNAVILPKLCVERIAKDELKEYQPAKDKLVSIVDCVGVIPPPQRTMKEPGVTRRAYADSDTGFTPTNPVRLIGIETSEEDTY